MVWVFKINRVFGRFACQPKFAEVAVLVAVCLLLRALWIPAAQSEPHPKRIELAPHSPAASTNSCSAMADGRQQPEYRKLVEGLASPNKPIERLDEDDLRVPPDYDWEAQQAIEKNRQSLYEHCAEALPFLVERCADARYSLTRRSDSYVRSVSVGEACSETIAAHVEVYRRYMTFSKKRYYAYCFVPTLHGANGKQSAAKTKAIEVWWNERKGKSLIDLPLPSGEHRHAAGPQGAMGSGQGNLHR